MHRPALLVFDANRREFTIHDLVIVQRESNLLEMVVTFHPSWPWMAAFHCRNQQCKQQDDHAEYGQELDQSQPLPFLIQHMNPEKDDHQSDQKTRQTKERHRCSRLRRGIKQVRYAKPDSLLLSRWFGFVQFQPFLFRSQTKGKSETKMKAIRRKMLSYRNRSCWAGRFSIAS